MAAALQPEMLLLGQVDEGYSVTSIHRVGSECSTVFESVRMGSRVVTTSGTTKQVTRLDAVEYSSSDFSILRSSTAAGFTGVAPGQVGILASSKNFPYLMGSLTVDVYGEGYEPVTLSRGAVLPTAVLFWACSPLPENNPP